MRKATAACLVAAAAGLFGFTGGPPPATPGPDTLHVAPDGRGSSCSTAEPCSLHTARQRTRALIPHATGDVVVELRGGTYRLTSPFRLGVEDSGRPGHPVVYRAGAGQTPVLSGATRITGFSRVDTARNIYRADVPRGTQSRELFVNGVRAVRARGPMNPSGFSAGATGFTTSDPSYASWVNPAQVEVVETHASRQMRCPLASITRSATGGSDLTVDPACWNNNHHGVPNPGFPYNPAGQSGMNGISWLENAYQLLGTPGQFYLDTSAGRLYYVPRAGEDLATADVELPLATTLLEASGTPGHLAPVNDTDWRAVYTGSWGYSSGRDLGDMGGDVHYTATDGDAVAYTFNGTGIQVLSETNSDEGDADVYLDGEKMPAVSGKGAERLAQQAMVSITGLPKGPHTLRLVKTSGTYLLVDGFTVIPDVVAPVHDLVFSGLTFAHTTWNAPTAAGYVDNRAGVIWDPAMRTPSSIPAAVQVHRGARLTFSGIRVRHTGGSGIALADQTQDSTVTASSVTDTSGTGVAIGEVDDHYQTDPALMTSGNTVSRSIVRFPGQEYQDAVGIRVGHSTGTVIAHNDVGYTPYSGISVGWGWGWTSNCTTQAAQGLPGCRRGTSYAGGNKIVGNHVHSVLGALVDGGPIHTIGGQSAPSELAGNVASECVHGCSMIYHDEGSSRWNTHDNVVRFSNGAPWITLRTPTAHDDSVHDNYSDTASHADSGTGTTFEQADVVTDGNWPPAAQAIVDTAGPGTLPGKEIDDDDLRVRYAGAWSSSGSRGVGDRDDGVHYTQRDGASATITFTGTGIGFLTETNRDEGDVAVRLDGVPKGTVSANTPERHVRQTLYSVSGLHPGRHTLTVTKLSGAYLLVDGFTLR